MKNFPISTPRQRRALEALAEREVSSLELRTIVGMLNVPQLVSDLRSNGWEIKCRRISVLDRDGKKCRPGIYYLPDKVKTLVWRVLKMNAEETAVTVSAADTEVSFLPSKYNKGVKK